MHFVESVVGRSEILQVSADQFVGGGVPGVGDAFVSRDEFAGLIECFGKEVMVAVAGQGTQVQGNFTKSFVRHPDLRFDGKLLPFETLLNFQFKGFELIDGGPEKLCMAGRILHFPDDIIVNVFGAVQRGVHVIQGGS